MGSNRSFTGGNTVRYPAPDVARGVMLILISLAHVGLWSQLMPVQATPTTLDAVFTVLRVGLVDVRAYPLFAMLFGFGLAVMARRRITHQLHSTNTSPTDHENTAHENTVHWGSAYRETGTALEDAQADARRLLRRRGWWMLPFGFVHGLIFPTEVIGTYGILALACAGLISRGKHRQMLAIATPFFIVSIAAAALRVFISQDASPPFRTLEGSGTALLSNISGWLVTTVAGLVFTAVVMATSIGVYLASTDVLTSPEKHRRLLLIGAVSGLSVAMFSGLPQGLAQVGALTEVGYGAPTWWMYCLSALGGLAGGWGWLSLITALTGPAPVNGQLRGIRWVLSAVGRRSMTAYIAQSVVFALLFLVLEHTGLAMSESLNVLIAWLVWAVIALACVSMEVAGRRGPLETLLRQAVAASARPRV